MALIPKDLCIDWPRNDPQSIHPWESESQPHSHLNVFRTFVCKSHFARAAKIRQKAGRPSRCQGETCIAVRSAPPVPLFESIFPQHLRGTIRSRGRESRCDFCRNVQSCQGTGNCALVETVGPAPASIFPFCHFCRPSVRG